MHITAIIPARYASARFPGKPLVDIHGKMMIERVYERTCRSTLVDRVIVATDDERIADAVRAFGGELCMTSAQHETGTDRLAEVAATLTSDLIVNVQGDEPLIDPVMIDQAVAPLIDDATISMGTLMVAIELVEEFLSPNVVKVVTDRRGGALYFSRSAIPCVRDSIGALAENFAQISAHKHVGLYVYRREFLLQYPLLSVTPLESMEKLEQLRVLEHGYRIQVVETSQPSIGVDTPEDLEKVRAIVAQVEGVK
ncbi:MAG: 3-deoxy-manno-octulosonate cytidylyltransferase [Thermodesulfobacteriota bacterium]|nr:3-deoxy-manno-octulosonate cytidylyltransferase [Thermodesulfobacteriota bacterium]